MLTCFICAPTTDTLVIPDNIMDILRKELNNIYNSQNLSSEKLDSGEITRCRSIVRSIVCVNNACAVLTDAASDRSYLYTGSMGALLGITERQSLALELNSSDEDLIYNRLHPADLPEKRMLEYEFFKYVDTLPVPDKLRLKATCRIRIKNHRGVYIPVYNTTRLIALSPAGKIWLVFCCYELSETQAGEEGISPTIVNNHSGEILRLSLSERKHTLLTPREKEILSLIKCGMASKQIAEVLGISINTVNRHRQNIIEKLSVANSIEAVTAASAMKLL